MTELPDFAAAVTTRSATSTNAIGVHHLQTRSVQAAFKAAAQEGLEQPVVQRVFPFRMLFHGAALAIQMARDFVGQVLVP